jgi:UDP-N-acetylmuramoyl-tripeptide--D-alanyl-D-alanine ligase
MDGSFPSNPRSTERPFEAAWIAQVLGLSRGDASKSTTAPPSHFSAFTTDSRKIPESGIFVAIRGEKMDGHEFIAAAIAAGATGVLAEKSVIDSRGLASHFPSIQFFGVDDVVAAFRKLSAAWRSKFSIPVIMVAGANGKTTTKELLSALLRGRHEHVLKTIGSQNGFLGIPMTLIELRPHHGAAVIEVGIDEIGAMAQHVPVVKPTHTVLTVIGPEHLEKLIDVPTVAREECLAFHETRKLGGSCVVNLDDPWIARELSKLPGAWSFGIDQVPGTPGVAGTHRTSEGRNLLDVELGGTELTLEVPLPGRHNAQNLLAAVTTAAAIGLTTQEIQKGLATFEGAEGRSQIRPLPSSSGTLVICDYYNASPVSMGAAFQLLAQTGTPQATRIACLADMKELGTDELKLHSELSSPLLKSGATVVLLHGTRMKSLFDALKKTGFSGTLAHFDDLHTMAAEARRLAAPGSVILIKGSRSMKMETVWQELMKA